MSIESRLVILQEYLPHNGHDYRRNVTEGRSFGFRRFNLANDFRASGSSKSNPDSAVIAPEFVLLALMVAEKLGTQSCAIDGPWRGEEAVVGEISYTYA